MIRLDPARKNALCYHGFTSLCWC